jgi:YebC/PmpR family DNA-binding regulatory protein
MSGHSKWSTIKRAKGAADAKRSQLFTKLAKAITVAARDGADADTNPKLRLAIDRARSFSMPKDNIERAIQKGSGASEESVKLEAVRYEAYGPGGVALLIDAVTDNRNRTSAEIRHLLEKHGGRLADAGSVAWMFELKGVAQITKPANWEEFELWLIEAGADDIQTQGEDIILTCPPEAFADIKELFESKNITPGYLSLEPVAKINISAGEAAYKLNELREALESNEDVTNIFDNAE